jgi:flagellar hook-associated protein 1 FlgK
MKLANLSDSGGKILIGGQYYYYQDWQYNNDGTFVNGIYQNDGTYTLTLDDEKCDQIINTSKLGTEAVVGGAVNYQGVPYFMTQMNAWLRGFSEKVNDIFTGGFDVQGNNGCIVFTANSMNSGQYGATDFITDPPGSPGSPTILPGMSQGLYLITAGNIAILNELMNNADRLGTKSQESAGIDEYKQVEKMVELLNSKSAFNFRNGTAKDFLELLLGDIALGASNANTFYKTYKGLSNSIDNQRNSVSGVDEDEEAVNLVKFQHAYNLSSRMIQALSEVYNRLILQTGV